MKPVFILVVMLVLILPARVALADTYIVANSHSWPPMAYTEGDEPVGLLVDFWKLYSQYNQQSVEFHLVDWADSLTAVKEGRAHIHGGLLYSSPRSEYLVFSKPLFPMVTGVFVRSDVAKPDAWSKQTLGAVASSFESEYVAERYPDAAVLQFKNNRDLVIAALHGQIGGFVCDYPTGIYLIRELAVEDKLKFHKMLYSKPVHVAVGLSNKALMDEVNRGIAKIPRDQVEALVAEWQPTGESPSQLAMLAGFVLKSLFFLIVLAVVLMGIKTFISRAS